MAQYICNQCGKEYEAITADGFCTNQPDCEYGTGWLKEAGTSTENATGSTADSSAATEGPAPMGFGREAGLCVLMMDGSLSMNEPAFPESDYPGNRYKLVSMNAAGGIWSLKTMTHAEDAFIALAVFGGKPKLIWIKSVRQILDEYGSADGFGDYIYEVLEKETPDARFTNLNEAVGLAYEIHQAYLKGDLTPFGGEKDFKPVMHSMVRSKEGGEDFIEIPNGRVLIYTDGEHNVTSAVKNPFAGDEQSILISAFIGEADAKGVGQMQGLAAICPKHAPEAGFFLVNSPERVQTLKGLFRMASGASGFCPLCLKTEQAAPVPEPVAPEEGVESTDDPNPAEPAAAEPASPASEMPEQTGTPDEPVG